MELCTNTYNAYNKSGGASYYSNPRDKAPSYLSFLRPPGSQFTSWEKDFVIWAEKNNIEMEYCANNDLVTLPLEKYKLIISVGHDEYWSLPMREAVEGYIARGGNYAWFSGNTCCWQIRMEDDGNTMCCFKTKFLNDPVLLDGGDLRTLTTLWSYAAVKRPENTMTGVGVTWGGYHHSMGKFNDESTYTVYRPDHWVFEGTGLKKGDKLGNAKDKIVGYECDGCETIWKDGLPYPTHTDDTPHDFTILAQAPAQWWTEFDWFMPKERIGNASLGLFTRNGTVFTVGSTDWSRGLRGNDAKVERVTKNVIDKLSK